MRWSFATIVLVPRGRLFVPPSPNDRRRIFAWAKAAGFEGIELADDWLDFHSLNDRVLRELRSEFDEAGLQVSGLNIPRCLFTREPHATPEFARVERAVSAAPILAADVVNLSLSTPVSTNPFRHHRPIAGSSVQVAEQDRAAELVSRLADCAKSAGTSLAIELHDDGLLDTSDLCLRLLKRVNRPNVGLNPDVANLCRGPGPLPDWRHAFELLAPRANNWHVKNYRCFQPVPLAEGDIDFAVAWNIMCEAGYSSWVSIESRFGDVLAEQRTSLDYLRALAAPNIAPLPR